MVYSNIDFNVVYVDPSKSSSGDGTTPAKALNALPSTVAGYADNTAYLIRRTAETSAAVLPSGTNSSISNILFIGMPNASDELYTLMPDAVKSAWGADSAEYANLKYASSSGNFSLPSIKVFLLHRVYLFRDSVNADSYILRFYNSTGHVGCYAFEHCKFGSKGVDLDKASYTGALTSSRCKAYVYIHYARMLSIRDSIINHALTGNSSNGDGIHCHWADFLDVEDVAVYSAAWTDYSQYYPLNLSGTYEKGVECQIRNVTQTVRMNGSAGTHVPTLMSVQGYVSCDISGIGASLGTALDATAPSSFQLDYPMVYVYNAWELSIKDVTVNLPNFWNCRSPVLELERCQSGNYIPGVVKKLENISVALATDSGIGSPISYSYATTANDSYAAVSVNFSSSDTTLYAKVPQISNLNVVCPRGKAAYIENARMTDSSFQGTVVLNGVVADIDSISTWFPGKCLYAESGTHVRVREMTVNTENPDYAYSEDPAVFSGLEEQGNVFVDSSNVSLAPVAASSSKTDHIYQGIGCNNEGAEGHFCFRCANGICDTWSAHRTGGGAAALKFWNNTCSGADTMAVGRRPFNGMELTPSTTGRHLLKAHIACKGFSQVSELYRHFIVSATVNGRRYYSTLHGRWADDSASVWENDSDLVQLVLEMPIDIAEAAPVDVRVYFSWYSSAGFVYLDPAIELESA